MSYRSRLAALFFAPALFAACARTPTAEPEEEPHTVIPLPIEQVVDRHAPELMKIEGVTMVFVGLTDEDRPCVRVGFDLLPHPNQDQVPSELEGYPVVLEATGEIRPMSGK